VHACFQTASQNGETGRPLRRQAVQCGGRCALNEAGFPEIAVQAMLATVPDSLMPARRGVELLTRQRREVGLPGADNSYDSLVDASMLPRDAP